MKEVKSLVDAGAIGDLIRLDANFGFRAAYNPDSRLFNNAFGGGALLDIGVYNLSMAQFFMGEPESMMSASLVGPTNVDHHNDTIFQYGEGKSARLACGLDYDCEDTLILYGTGASIHIPRFWSAEEYIIKQPDGNESHNYKPFEANGHEYIMRAFLKTMEEGQTEPPLINHHESLTVMKQVDAVVKAGGWSYRT